MNGDQFTSAATHATARLDLDTTALLEGVYAKHRRRTRHRRLLVGAPVAAALAVGGATLLPALTPDGAPAAVAAYAFADVPPGADPLVEVDGVGLTYLPDDVAAAPASTATTETAAGTTTEACFEERCASGLAVAVTRAPGLTLDGYLRSSWFGDAVETSVGGRPALANGVTGDEATGLLWSPEDGVVIEVHLGSGDAAQLRQVVEQMRL